MKRDGRPPRWTPDQLDFLREQAAIKPIHTLALKMGMSKATARWYLRKWGMTPVPLVKRWTPEEIQRLTDMVADHTLTEIAQVLGRSEGSVRVKAHTLGFSVNQSIRRKWTQEEDAFLWRAAETLTMRQTGARLNRSVMSVWGRCKKLGIRWFQGRRSCKEVAEDLGCHRTYIPRLAKKAGVDLEPICHGDMRNITDEQYEAICEVWFNP